MEDSRKLVVLSNTEATCLIHHFNKRICKVNMKSDSLYTRTGILSVILRVEWFFMLCLPYREDMVVRHKQHCKQSEQIKQCTSGEATFMCIGARPPQHWNMCIKEQHFYCHIQSVDVGWWCLEHWSVVSSHGVLKADSHYHQIGQALSDSQAH